MLHEIFNNVRFRVALYYIKKAETEINKGGYKNIKKGIKYLKRSVIIVPPSKELSDYGRKLKMELNKIYGPKEEG